jgi:uncharacterized membrane protein
MTSPFDLRARFYYRAMWGIAFRARQFAKGSLWLLPLVGALFGAVLGSLTVSLESHQLAQIWDYSPATATTLLSAVVGSTAALTGFVVTVSVLVVQMATGTFSARYMRLWYRDGLLKATLAVIVGTLTFSFALLRRVSTDFVPNLGVTAAGIFLFVGILFFLLFLDRFVHRLRPVAVAALVARAGRRALEESPATTAPVAAVAIPEGAPALRVKGETAGAIQAVHASGLVRWARKHDCVVVLRQAVGDFVPSGRVLMEVYGDVPAHAERQLRSLVAFGVERTIDQDAGFAVRIMVDVAIRALSPAVNDPTTAVQVLDHLEELLRVMGTTSLERRGELRDDAGRLRVVVPSQRWEDFLSLAVTEIREYGANSIQVMRRLRTLLDGLHDEVLEDYRPAVEEELRRLDATVHASFGASVDLDRAAVADRQGIGGPHTREAPVQPSSRGTT